MRSKKFIRARIPGITCPHCDHNAVARNGKVMAPTVRELTYVCSNEGCGHKFVASLSIERTLVASATPRAGIEIPFSERTCPRPKPANDDQPVLIPPAANDQAMTLTG